MKQNRFFDDLSKLASSASGTFVEMKNEMESVVSAQVEKFLRRANLVSREDFEVVRDVALKARAEQEKLAKRVAELEKQLAPKATAKPATKPVLKPAPKPTAKASPKPKAKAPAKVAGTSAKPKPKPKTS